MRACDADPASRRPVPCHHASRGLAPPRGYLVWHCTVAPPRYPTVGMGENSHLARHGHTRPLASSPPRCLCPWRRLGPPTLRVPRNARRVVAGRAGEVLINRRRVCWSPAWSCVVWSSGREVGEVKSVETSDLTTRGALEPCGTRSGSDVNACTPKAQPPLAAASFPFSTRRDGGIATPTWIRDTSPTRPSIPAGVTPTLTLQSFALALGERGIDLEGWE